jgi:membrane-associated phospholipid phosphatase
LKTLNLNKTTTLKSVFLTLRTLCIIFLFSSTQNGRLSAQAYSTNWTRDASIWGVSALHYAVNKQWENRVPIEGNYWRTIGIDKWAPTELRKPLAWASDNTKTVCFASFAAMGFFLPTQDRIQYWQLGAQNVLIAGNITQSIKLTARRARPFNQPGYPYDHRDQFYSFISGHSSTTAAAATTAILAMRSQPDLKKAANVIAIGSGALALSTATLRVAAGKHYPSDVLAGMALGVGVALLNQTIHERF